jgi:diaminopimelate epimerase
MHGFGNDFVVLDRLKDPSALEDEVALAKMICDRHFGVGSDGLLFLESGNGSAFRMRMLNPDGSDGGMCGNGVRCVAKLAQERGYVKDWMELQVGERSLNIDFVADDVRVDMGQYSLLAEDLGLLDTVTEPFIGGHIEAKGYAFQGVAVSMGNPHLVFTVEDVKAMNVASVGPIFEHHPWFRKRTNVQFVEVKNRTSVHVRTWERGAGETLACGSGACAVAVAMLLTGRCDPAIDVYLPGGVLKITVQPDRSVILQGAARVVFEGVWPLPG